MVLSPRLAASRVPWFYVGAGALALLYVLSSDLPFDQETFAADVGDASGAAAVPSTAAAVPSAAAAEFPGKSDGFTRSLNEKGEEVFTLDCGNATTNMNQMCGAAEYEGQTGAGCMVTNTCQNNQVYVIPANDYYAWHAQHYCATCHLTSSILHALLFAHIYSTLAYPRTTFYTSVHTSYRVPTTSYYSSTGYSSRYGAPAVANGRVVHTPSAAAVAGRGPTGPVRGAALGTPVAQARPIAQARPVGGTPMAQARPVGGTPMAQARPVGGTPMATAVGRPVGGTPVYQARPVGGTPTATARPASSSSSWSRPTTSSSSSRWGSVRASSYGSSAFRSHSSSFRSHSSYSCFTADAAVTLASGATAPISTLAVGDLVAGWPNASAVLNGHASAPMRVGRIERHADGYAPLRGFHLTLNDGRELVQPPFVTTNHPLLLSNGSWSAVDAPLAHAELAAYKPDARAWAAAGRAYHVPELAPLAAGARVFVVARAAKQAAKAGATAAAASNTDAAVNLSPTAATVERVLEEKPTEAAGKTARGAVYSLELDAANLAVYIVNGLLSMD